MKTMPRISCVLFAMPPHCLHLFSPLCRWPCHHSFLCWGLLLLSSCSPLSSSVHLIIFSMSTHNTTASLTENQEKDHFDDGITIMVCPLPPIPHNLLICFPPLPPTEQQTKHWGMAAHNVSTPTICQATQGKHSTLIHTKPTIQKKKHTRRVELSGTSPVKQRCVTKSCVSGFQQILCQRGNPQRRLVSNPREGGQSSQILCNLCSHPGYQHQGQNPRMKPRIANNWWKK